jgi:hypothetical protein
MLHYIAFNRLPLPLDQGLVKPSTATEDSAKRTHGSSRNNAETRASFGVAKRLVYRTTTSGTLPNSTPYRPPLPLDWRLVKLSTATENSAKWTHGSSKNNAKTRASFGVAKRLVQWTTTSGTLPNSTTNRPPLPLAVHSQHDYVLRLGTLQNEPSA